MFTIPKYDFGYHWLIGYGPAIPLALGIALGALALWRNWRWAGILAGVIVVWALGSLYLINITWGINKPMDLPTARFLESGGGQVLDVGAGSGRAAVGVLLARPRAVVTGLDLYNPDLGYGIAGNTPDRFMRNAQIAGAADRADAQRGDMRQLPFPDASFDAVVSSYAIDHVWGEGRTRAIREVARVLKPGGEFLLMIVNVDWWAWLVSPPMAHHPRVDSAAWRALLQQSGFMIDEEGTPPVTRYWLARKAGGGTAGGGS